MVDQRNRADVSGAVMAMMALRRTPALPAYVSSGTGAAASATTCTPAYPSSPANADLFILEAFAFANSGVAISAPVVWTQINTVTGNAGKNCYSVFYKKSDGTETGTITVTNGGSGSPVCVGKIHLFRVTGGFPAMPYDTTASVATQSTSVTAAALTTTDVNRLCVQCVMIGSNIAQSNFTGESGTDYAKAASDYLPSSPAASLGLQTGSVLTPAAVTGGAFVITSTAYGVIGFNLHG